MEIPPAGRKAESNAYLATARLGGTGAGAGVGSGLGAVGVGVSVGMGAWVWMEAGGDGGTGGQGFSGVAFMCQSFGGTC
jgi:hypothetical protein